MTRIEPVRRSKSFNWMGSTCRSLQTAFPAASKRMPYVTERLSALLLERLPTPLGLELLSLLPETEEARESGVLRSCAEAGGDPSIGFPCFLERARHALGMGLAEGAPEEELDRPEGEEEDPSTRYETRVAETFLWNIAHELPVDIKERMIDSLPGDLRNRMNLYCAGSDEAKVA